MAKHKSTLRAAACNIVEELMDCLNEAHAPDRDTKVRGRNHNGDGPKHCLYCRALNRAKRFLIAYDGRRDDPE